jgi:hypothetical protein
MSSSRAVSEMGFGHPVTIVAHPSNIPALRIKNSEATETRPPKPPLDRNRDIVDAVDVLLVGPKGPEELRSGTWSCVRYARRKGVRRVIFWPDGTIEEEK